MTSIHAYNWNQLLKDYYVLLGFCPHIARWKQYSQKIFGGITDFLKFCETFKNTIFGKPQRRVASENWSKLEILQNIQETPVMSPFFNKVAGWRPVTLRDFTRSVWCFWKSEPNLKWIWSQFEMNWKPVSELKWIYIT